MDKEFFNLYLCKYDNKDVIILAEHTGQATTIFQEKYGHFPECVNQLCSVSKNCEFIGFDEKPIEIEIENGIPIEREI